MKIATLVLLRRGDKVLLGFKKRGEIGDQTLNAPGGKLEEGETIKECAIRETREEVGVEIDPTSIEEFAVITFHKGGVPSFEVHIFDTDAFTGEPSETKDMRPEGWFSENELPFDRMLDSDREWFHKAVRREKFRADVFYREEAKGFQEIRYLPY